MLYFERILAGVVAGICVLLLVRLFLGERRRQRVDRAVLEVWQAGQRAVWALWHWRASRQAKAHAAEVAQQAIERARRHRVDRRGNVYTPEAFKEPRKPE